VSGSTNEAADVGAAVAAAPREGAEVVNFTVEALTIAAQWTAGLIMLGAIVYGIDRQIRERKHDERDDS
jgi:pyocin large subunit-like protein